MRGIIDHQIGRTLEFCFDNRSEPSFVCLVGVPVCLDSPAQLARLDIAAEIGDVPLILKVQGNVLLGLEQLIPECGATSVIYAQFYHSLGAEVGAAGKEVFVLVD